MNTRVLIISALVIVVAVVGYLSWDRDAKLEPPSETLDTRSLRNAEYLSESAESGRVQLRDGRLIDEAARVWVTMLNVVAYGDVNGDGVSDAAVILATNTGGSGVFHDLAVVVDRDGRPVNVAITNIGDRVKINSISVDRQRIVLDLVTQGPSDPMCCPTNHVIQKYELQGGTLVLVDEKPISED
jgi:hypothetical protein